ncbi:MAG TPA: permease prefix domain 1-containing protein [Aeromicrobium sp.]|nr:permease prefix domain 1-containing protein [Aeromicrobium sp.]
MTTLTDRYVASVLRLIPEAHREDIQAELKVAIEDAIDEKVAYGQTHDAAERAVLNGLGEPARLAAEYSHRPLWLIGPDYYLAWLRLMKWLLWTLPVFVGAGTVALRLFVGEPALDALWSGLVVALIVALNVAVWSTVGFIIVERSPDTKPSDLGPLDRWSVKCLPATAIVDRQFSLIATIGGVILNVFLIALLSSLLSLEDVSILNTSAWTISVSVLIVLLAASAISSVIRYARGRWTPTLAIVNAILDAAFAGWWWWALWNLSILDPQLIARLDAESGLLTWARSVVLVILAVCAWDAVSGFTGRGRAVGGDLPAVASDLGER